MTSGLFWVFYIALEPVVRRRWPQVLISWTRLLSGEWRDPLVGREVLVGCVLGVFSIGIALATQNPYVFRSALNLDFAKGVGPFISGLSTLCASVFMALAYLCLLSVVRLIVRHDTLAIAAVLLLQLAVGWILTGSGSWTAVAANRAIYSLYLFVLTRLGLVAVAIGFVVEFLFTSFPITLQPSAWYSTAGYFALALAATLAFFGFWTSLGGRPLLTVGSED
jgi:hypothetical protein